MSGDYKQFLLFILRVLIADIWQRLISNTGHSLRRPQQTSTSIMDLAPAFTEYQHLLDIDQDLREVNSSLIYLNSIVIITCHSRKSA